MEIFKYERELELLVKHNIQKYKYIGEEGREYEVIQSVFYEINQLGELSNRQIRWYAFIINLVTSFYNQRRRCDLPDSLIVETPDGFQAGTKIRERETAGEIYKRLILRRIGSIAKKKIAAYHNMEAFWNGFITDNFSPMMIG